MIVTLALFQLLSATPQCGPLDLPGSIARALHSSDEVAIRQAELYGADADLSLAKAAQWFPQATVTVIGGPAPDAHGNVLNFMGQDNRTISELGPFVRVDASAIQPLWTWGQLSAARDAARAGVSARTLLVHDQAARVQVRVVDLYWGIALAHRLLDLAADVENALDKADQTIADALASNDGSVGLDDKYRVAVFRGQLGVRRADAAKGLAMARAGLAATLAMPEPELKLKDEALPTTAPAPSPRRRRPTPSPSDSAPISSPSTRRSSQPRAASTRPGARSSRSSSRLAPSRTPTRPTAICSSTRGSSTLSTRCRAASCSASARTCRFRCSPPR